MDCSSKEVPSSELRYGYYSERTRGMITSDLREYFPILLDIRLVAWYFPAAGLKVKLRAEVDWIIRSEFSRDAYPHHSASGFFSKTGGKQKNDQQYLDS
jgi:hypothetical protein